MKRATFVSLFLRLVARQAWARGGNTPLFASCGMQGLSAGVGEEGVTPLFLRVMCMQACRQAWGYRGIPPLFASCGVWGLSAGVGGMSPPTFTALKITCHNLCYVRIILIVNTFQIKERSKKCFSKKFSQFSRQLH
jgi:hypothetical protein